MMSIKLSLIELGAVGNGQTRVPAVLGGIPSPSILSDATIPPRYLIGTPDTIQEDLAEIALAFDAEEIMVQCISNNMANRLKCLELLAEAFELRLNKHLK